MKDLCDRLREDGHLAADGPQDAHPADTMVTIVEFDEENGVETEVGRVDLAEIN